ncbi:MAG: hypothetical protein M3416_04930 [Acidobacteriota bacterium]|nr:hypothetical protein [Acidobacteriota bacterium]
MTRWQRFLLVAVIAASAFVPGYRAAGLDGDGEAKSSALDVEISRAGAEASYVPALGEGPGRYTVIRAAESLGAGASGARVYGVKVAPRLEGGAVRISLSILSGKFDEVTSCEQVKALREEPAATYLVRRGESVRVTQFEGLGIEPFEVKVVAAEGGEQNTRQTGCCTCAGGPCCVPKGQECRRCHSCICCVA